jgi:hypothetical protein
MFGYYVKFSKKLLTITNEMIFQSILWTGMLKLQLLFALGSSAIAARDSY